MISAAWHGFSNTLSSTESLSTFARMEHAVAAKSVAYVMLELVGYSFETEVLGLV